MYKDLEATIHPQNHDEIHRVFVMTDVEPARLLLMARRVMDVYADVTGKKYSGYDLDEYPQHMVDSLQDPRRRFFELSFGIPELSNSARDHGKLKGKNIMTMGEDRMLDCAGFWIVTNGFDSITPQQEVSVTAVNDFNVAIRDLADVEFADLAVPIPHGDLAMGFYNPTLPKA